MSHVDKDASLIKRYVLYATGPMFGIVAFFITNGSATLKPENIAPLIWAMIAYIIGQHIANIFDHQDSTSSMKSELLKVERKIDETSSAFTENLTALFKVTSLTPDGFDSRVKAVLASAYHVKNTYIGIKDLTGVKTPRQAQIVEYYRLVLEKPQASWEDIIGVGELLDGRITDVFGSLDRVRGAYSPYVFDNPAPIMNFILAGPQGSQLTDVFFGWVKSSATDVYMFHSRDRGLIEMFYNYFQSLKAAPYPAISIANHETNSPKEWVEESFYKRISGYWLSVSGTTPQDVTKIRSYAVLHISFDGVWNVKGRVINRASGKTENSIVSEFCTVVENTVFYQYYTLDEFGIKTSYGIGVYSLSIDEGELKGYYVIKGNKLANLRANKLTDEEFNDNQKRVACFESMCARKT